MLWKDFCFNHSNSRNSSWLLHSRQNMVFFSLIPSPYPILFTILTLYSPASHFSLQLSFESVLLKIVRIKEMITNLRGFDCWTNSPSQHLKKCIVKSMENLYIDVWV